MPAATSKDAKSRSSSFADSIDREELASRTSSQETEANKPAAPAVVISRNVIVPDPLKVARCLRLPEYGPRILFFSGGSALKDLSIVLKHYTHHSIHLITPFDSGGSSAEIRRAFDMLSVGDLRNRLMALSDDSPLGSNNIKDLFSHRLSSADSLLAQAEFTEILNGHHPLSRAVVLPMRRILTSHLRWFAQRMPEDFDLRGASIGNLIITGCYLEHHRDVVTAIYLIWTLLGVKGIVRPMTGANLHLRVCYQDGTEQVGQHLLGKHSRIGLHGRIESIDLVESLQQTEQRQPAQTCHIDSISADLLASADLLCYPMGSFFGSVLGNLLPTGVGRSIVQRQCPKIYIPNTGTDPEMYGYTLTSCLERIIDMVRQDADADADADSDGSHPDGLPSESPVNQIVNFVLIDTTYCRYCIDIDREEIRTKFDNSVVVLDLCLVDDQTKQDMELGVLADKSQELDATKVAEVLLTLGS